MTDKAISDLTGWSKTGILKTQQGVQSFQTMQANFEVNKGRMGAGAYTIQFGINLPQLTGAALGVAFARADITWSIQGGSVNRTIDIANGRLVSGTGQAIKIRMYDVTPILSPTPLPGAGTPYGVFCQVTKGTRPSQNQPPTLQDFPLTLSLAGGATLSSSVAPDAGVISVEVTGYDETANADATIQVRMLTASGLITKEYMSPGASHFVPLAPGTATVSITNRGTNTINTMITYGIDG